MRRASTAVPTRCGSGVAAGCARPRKRAGTCCAKRLWVTWTKVRNRASSKLLAWGRVDLRCAIWEPREDLEKTRTLDLGWCSGVYEAALRTPQMAAPGPGSGVRVAGE